MARTQVDNDDSYVVQHDSSDRELYVHKSDTFFKNYVTPGTEMWLIVVDTVAACFRGVLLNRLIREII